MYPHLPPRPELDKTTRRRQSRQVPSFLYKIQQSINVLSLSLQSYSRKVGIASLLAHCFILGKRKTLHRMEKGPPYHSPFSASPCFIVSQIAACRWLFFSCLPFQSLESFAFVYYYAANVATRRDYGGK